MLMMCPCIQTSNLQKLDWYISTKHIYVSDEYNIWKSPLGNYMQSSINKYYGADINPLFNFLFIYLFFCKMSLLIHLLFLINRVRVHISIQSYGNRTACICRPYLIIGQVFQSHFPPQPSFPPEKWLYSHLFPLPYQGGKMAIQQNFPAEKWLYSGFFP